MRCAARHQAPIAITLMAIASMALPQAQQIQPVLGATSEAEAQPSVEVGSQENPPQIVFRSMRVAQLPATTKIEFRAGRLTSRKGWALAEGGASARWEDQNWTADTILIKYEKNGKGEDAITIVAFMM